MVRRIVPPLRNSDGPLFLESFMVSAVISFLGIRAFLTVTGFPQVGGGQLHIAHMLWGGAFMLVALVLLLTYLDRTVHHVAAVIAGLGFGTFVDEIGKFLTADNDYFFRPAVALIYVIFVVVFLFGRAIAGRRALSQTEALANALDLLEGTLGERLEPQDRARIVVMLDRSAPDAELAAAVRSYLATVPSRPDEEAWWERIPRWAAQRYAELGGVRRLVIATAPDPEAPQPLTVAALGQVVSTLAGAALIARGVIALPRSHIEAYRWFVRGVLVWILITQVFVFYDSQLAGLTGLAFDLAVYGILRFAIRREAAPITAAS